jgi:hypothetical protein
MLVLFLDEHRFTYDRVDGIIPSMELLLTRTLRSTHYAESITLYVGEFTEQTNIPWDILVNNAVDTIKPDLVFPYSLRIDKDWAMDCLLNVCNHCRNKGIPIFHAWPDMVTTEQIGYTEFLLDYMDKIVSFGDRAPPNSADANKYMVLFTPQDPSLFYDDNKPKTIPLCLNGEVRGRIDREWIISALHNAGIECATPSGRGEGRVTTKEYAAIQQRSQVSINASQHPTNPQPKGRPFEVTATRSMLLQSKNPRVEEYFDPGTHYVDFDGPGDLVDKAKFYTSHVESADRIARSGHRRYREKWTSCHFWKMILEEACT